MKVQDIMTQAAVTDAPDDTLSEAAAKMRQQQTGSLLVMEGSSLAGIVTERDVLRIVGEGRDPKTVSLRDAMTTNVVTVRPDSGLREAAEIMFEKWFRHLPVTTDNGDVVGVISLRDLLTLVARSMDEEPEALQSLTGHKLVRDRRLERVEAGDLD
ncbi:MAG: CBS domain-containing protein [Actinomycetota bacterium]